jgi:hypothetical protein
MAEVGFDFTHFGELAGFRPKQAGGGSFVIGRKGKFHAF